MVVGRRRTTWAPGPGAVCTPSRHMIMSGRTVWHLPNRAASDASQRAGARRILPNNTMAAVFNRAGYDTMRTCKKGNSYEAANKQFTVRHDATKRGGTDETGSAWHAEQVLEYLDEREAQRGHGSVPDLLRLLPSARHARRQARAAGQVRRGQSHGSQTSCRRQSEAARPAGQLPAGASVSPRPSRLARRGEGQRRLGATRRSARSATSWAASSPAVENIDIQIGRVLKKLEAMGELDNTYIFYTADHGIAIGRHGLQGKQNLYEHTWRVPFIVKGPGIKPGSRVQGNIYLLDVLAHALRPRRDRGPETIEGISFQPVLEGQAGHGARCALRRLLRRHQAGHALREERATGSSSSTTCSTARCARPSSSTWPENPDELLQEHHDRQRRRPDR